jgi:choline dehydrogenase-like flavoprotein
MAPQRYDAVIVGSGVTGGWAAKELTEAGLSVLLLDAGPALAPNDVPAADAVGDDSESFRERCRARQPIQSRHGAFHSLNRHLFVDDVVNPYSTPEDKPFEWIRSRQVGGRSVLWVGVTLRLSDDDLHAARRDGFGEDWPLSYEELRPFYDRAETFLGVCGACDGLPHLPDGRFQPPMPMTDGERWFRAVLSERFAARQVVHGRGIPRRMGERWPATSSQATTLQAASASGRLTLRSGAVVARVELTRDGARASGVRFIDARTGGEELAEGRMVVLCASTLESTRILLNSDLPDRSDALGRYLMDHPSLTFFADAVNVAGPPSEPLGGPYAIYVPRFRNLEERELRFLRGYGVWGGIQRRAGDGDDQARVFLIASGEMLPRAHNRIVLHPERRDAWGIPIAHIECELSANERALLDDASGAVREMVHAAGFRMTQELPSAPPGGYVHEVGTARMGDDPRRSVLNRYNQLWAVPNLLVTDGACFVTSGCQPPTLTMMALTIRACAHAAAALKRGEL